MIMELIYGVDIEKLTGNLFYVYIGFQVFDILTGLIRALKDRKINSSINFDGLIRKLAGVVGVVFLTFIDFYLNTGGLLIKTGVWLLIIYEVISIIENFKQVGIDFQFVMKYFDEEKYKDGKK